MGRAKSNQPLATVSNGMSPTFYVDWLADAHKSCPRLGIVTMLSVTSKIGGNARSFGLLVAWEVPRFADGPISRRLFGE